MTAKSAQSIDPMEGPIVSAEKECPAAELAYRFFTSYMRAVTSMAAGHHTYVQDLNRQLLENASSNWQLAFENWLSVMATTSPTQTLTVQTAFSRRQVERLARQARQAAVLTTMIGARSLNGLFDAFVGE